MAATFLFASALGFAATPPLRYTPADAVRAEWARRPPGLTPGQVAALPEADRARLDLSLKRIGAPGAAALLPPELENPTEPLWLERARAARTPQERFTALHFLNRLKSKEALLALERLAPSDAKAWPKHLHLENAVARARINGCLISPDLRTFLESLAKAGKVDPVRAQAARLRLVLAGLEKELLQPVEPTPGAVLALLDAWNAGPWEARKEAHLALLKCLKSPGAMGAEPAWKRLGLSKAPAWADSTVRKDACGVIPHRDFPAQAEILQRLLEGLPDPAPADTPFGFATPLPTDPALILVIQAELSALAKIRTPASVERLKNMARMEDPRIRSAALPALRAASPADADALRKQLLEGEDPTARGYAVDDLPAPPRDMESFLKRLWKPEELDGVQSLLGCLDKWKLPQGQEIDILKWLYAHPSWTVRYLAYERLAKLEKDAPWPEAPPPDERERRVLQEAVRLAEKGKPVRLRITFSGTGGAEASEARSVVLRLDPKVAPINVANLKLLAGEGFFNRHTVPRVVPDFVVQMGSPLDTMDGGPGTAVRCEDSLEWYGPGSVGMALSGKDTGGSQFFITTNATPHLTGRYTRVGAVEDPDHALAILDGLELGAFIEQVEVLP